MCLMTGDADDDGVLQTLLDLRRYQHNDLRAPHKPLFVLLALGHLNATGSSALPWAVAGPKLAELLSEFGPASQTAPVQAAAYPFTRLRSDGLWTLDRDVPMDRIGASCISGAILGNDLVSWSRTSSQVWLTASASGWAKMVRSTAATMSACDFGTWASRFRTK